MPVSRLVIRPHSKDPGGGFTVRRLLPAPARPAVGPFVFFDHFGPITAGPADQHDVRPHGQVGTAFGVASPVAVRSPTLYLDIELSPGDALPLALRLSAKTSSAPGRAARPAACAQNPPPPWHSCRR